MSKIFDLINELCPDGVEFRELGEIADIEKGTQLNKSLLSKDGKYPVMNGGINPSGYWHEYSHDADMIVISQGGASAGYVNWLDTRFFAGAHAFVINAKEKYILKRYAFHYLKRNQQNFMQSQYGAGIPALAKSELEKFKLPVPPMEVQREIVRILDSFTLLTAELTARKKQYEFYRDFLLSFDELDKNGGGCELKMLGEICELIRGNGLQKKDFVESGVPAIHYGQIYTYYGTFASKTKSFVSVDTARKLKKATKGDVLISGVSENIQDILKPLGWLGEEVAISGDMFALRPNKVVNTKFLTYMLQTNSFYKFKEKHAQGAKVTRVKSDRFLKFKIPVPSLQTQQKVVDILDKFDTLVNSITEGLPREIELRRKQYEHYRELLLNLKPKMTA